MSIDGVKWWAAKARGEKDVAKKIDALCCAIEEMVDVKTMPASGGDKQPSGATKKSLLTPN